MSESAEPVSRGGGRYPRTSGGLIGALLVTVSAVIAFALFRALTSDDDPTPVRTIDYTGVVQGARADDKLLVLAPPRLPLGWKATSATYTRGVSPTWRCPFSSTQRNAAVAEVAARVSAASRQSFLVVIFLLRSARASVGGAVAAPVFLDSIDIGALAGPGPEGRQDVGEGRNGCNG